jgi:phosphoenolpyruvate synthase/pyruvate phosphate dikinase
MISVIYKFLMYDFFNTNTGQESTVSGDQGKEGGAGIPDVDATHPDVIALVEQAVKDAEKTPVTLTPEIYLEILEEGIRIAEKMMREAKPDGPL